MKNKIELKCKVPNCDSKVYLKHTRLCCAHYKRMKKYGSYDLPLCESEKLMVDGMGKCAICKEIKPLSEFNNDNSKLTGKLNYCKTCYRAKRKLAYHINKSHHRKLFVLRKYKLTEEQLNDMFITQDSKCAICGFKTDDLYIDHNHKSGIVRGLLCSKCNFGIGNFNDEIILLEKAIDYLKKDKK